MVGNPSWQENNFIGYEGGPYYRYGYYGDRCYNMGYDYRNYNRGYNYSGKYNEYNYINSNGNFDAYRGNRHNGRKFYNNIQGNIYNITRNNYYNDYINRYNNIYVTDYKDKNGCFCYRKILIVPMKKHYIQRQYVRNNGTNNMG